MNNTSYNLNNSMINNNIKSTIDLFFDYFNFATYYYTPTKYNKKKNKIIM